MYGRNNRKKSASAKFRKRKGVREELMLASMLDILMTILFFLLKNYSSVVTEFKMGKDLSLPTSSAIVPPMPALQLVVTQKSVMLDEKEICRIVDGNIPREELYKDGVTLVRLAKALQEERQKTEYIQKKNDEHSFTGTIVMQADKALSFNVLKKVIYTAGISDFVMLKLAVLKKEES